MTSFREDVRRHFELEAKRFPVTPNLRSSVGAEAQRRAAERRSPEWVLTAVAAVLAVAIIGSLIAVAQLRRLYATPGGPPPPVAACRVTRAPQTSFVPPSPYPSKPPGSDVWYGTPDLWTSLPSGGTWSGLPYRNGMYTQKIFWWRNEADWRTAGGLSLLKVSGARLDGPARPMTVSPVTNASASDIGSAMLVAVEIPSAGCWKITGEYKQATLSYVVWIPA